MDHVHKIEFVLSIKVKQNRTIHGDTFAAQLFKFHCIENSENEFHSFFFFLLSPEFVSQKPVVGHPTEIASKYSMTKKKEILSTYL